ncbi:hypothetical protein BDV93DRAFT_288680 [Ceratobasidium sp. AG-I]|nr:hypothetical protein BDV93DRAFT_288680 [Ceratobasidium sp. AG-I]
MQLENTKYSRRRRNEASLLETTSYTGQRVVQQEGKRAYGRHQLVKHHRTAITPGSMRDGSMQTNPPSNLQAE